MIFTEEWIELEGFTNYFVSNKGNVRKVNNVVKNNRFALKELYLKKRLINGYEACTLIADGGKKNTVYIHTAIANCFIKKPDSEKRLIVVHKDGNKTNNIIDNLFWQTHSEFMKSQFDSGRRSNKELWKKRVVKYGKMGASKKPGRKSKISKKDRKKVIELYSTKMYTLKQIAEKYKCSTSHIHGIVHEKVD